MLSPNVTVLSNDTVDDIVSSGGGYYNFSAAASGVDDLHVGSIIVAGSGDGLLRRVTLVSQTSSIISLKTAPASLSDVFEQGALQARGQLNFAGAQDTLTDQSTRELPDGSVFSISVPFDASWQTSSGGYDSVQGTDNLSADYSLFANFSTSQGLTGFYFGLSLVGNLHASASLAQSVQESWSAPIASYTLDPILFFLGAVPVVLVPQVQFSVGLAVQADAGVTSSISTQEAIVGGIQYKSGTWAPVASESNSTSVEGGGVGGSASATAFLESPNASVLVYGVAGPQLEIEPSLGITAVLSGCPDLLLRAGLTGTAGLSLGFLTGSSLDLNYPLFDLNWQPSQTFAGCAQNVTFTESGLIPGSEWGVVLNGTEDESTNRTIQFSEVNGSYPFTILGGAEYNYTPNHGNVTVDGAPVAEAITFVPLSAEYYVTFTESGLGEGRSWTVDLAGYSEATTAVNLSFVEFAGSYAFSVTPPAGYTAVPSSGSVQVIDAAIQEYIAFDLGTAGKNVTIVAESTGVFAPNQVWAAPGSLVRLRLVNEGSSPVTFVLSSEANFTISKNLTAAELDAFFNASAPLVNATMGGTPGATVFVNFTAPTNGTYEFVSLTPGQFQSGMFGFLFAAAPIPIGSAFSAGNPVASTCPAGYTFDVQGCTSGDYTYTLTIETSTVTFGSLEFQVKTASGEIVSVVGSGGFSLMNISGEAAAQTTALTNLSMTMTWAVYGSGYSAETPLTTLYTIIIDMGTSNPTGEGFTFEVEGAGAYGGSTSPLSLP